MRRAGIGGRARLAGELRDMDDEVCFCCTITCLPSAVWIISARASTLCLGGSWMRCKLDGSKMCKQLHQVKGTGLCRLGL